MAVRKVLTYGDPLLREKAEPVHKVSKKIQNLIDDLFDTMYAYDGVGLAATQIGVMKRVFVLDCSMQDNPLPQMAFVNPVIVKKSGAIVSKEGCLSFPNVYTEVKRYENITVRYTDEKGKRKEMVVEGGGLLCRAIQHELDHLDGILFVDHVMDRFTTDTLLEENDLPPVEVDKILEEPELDKVLMSI